MFDSDKSGQKIEMKNWSELDAYTRYVTNERKDLSGYNSQGVSHLLNRDIVQKKIFQI